VSLGSILLVVTTQLLTLLAPLALGLTGVITGGVAGLLSLTAWALIGVPLSYTVLDFMRAASRAVRSRETASAGATTSALTT